MEPVAVVIMLALIEYTVFGMLVGWARGKYSIEAPATTGHPVFERYFRVQMNTQESLMMLLPGLVLFGFYYNANYAAILGLVWIVGRIVYLRAYVADPKKRSLGFMLSFVPNVILVIGGGIAALMNMV
ncbi:MAG: MAPEG family protein [Pseudohongiellaceae bacterium]